MSTQNITQAPGQLDPGFGINGTTLLEGSSVQGLVVLTSQGPDNDKIVGVTTQGAEFKLFRLEKNGGPDNGFGIDPQQGYTTWSFGNKATTRSFVTGLRIIENKLFVMGYVRDNPSSSDNHPAVACFNPDGSPNLIFGQSAVFTFREQPLMAGQAPASTQQNTSAAGAINAGKILFAFNSYLLPPYRDWGLLIQLTETGQLDKNFNNSGFLFFKHEGGSTSSADAVTQTNGKIVVAGSVANKGFLWGFTESGGTDHSFGTNGSVTFETSPGSIQLTRLLLQPDDKPVAIGRVINGTSRQGWTNRTQANGKPDVTFAGGNPLVTQYPFQSSQWVSGGLATTKSIYLAGELNTRGLALVALIKGDGTPEQAFGENGLSDPFAPGMPNYTTSAAVLADDKIVIAGRKDNKASVSRFLA